jgi:hypothetical protein
MKKKWKTNSPSVLENLVLELQPTHGKKGKGSTIPTKETTSTPMRKE